MIVFGGFNQQLKSLRDVQVYDVETDTWQEMQVTGELPEARAAHSAVYINGKMIVFGGNTQTGFLTNTYILDLGNNNNHNQTLDVHD